MVSLNKRYIYRMTHIDNIPHILKHGITHQTSVNANPHFKPIGNAELINKRKELILKNKRAVGDYIPFYFAFRTPMLYAIQHGYGVDAISAEHLIYCVSTVQKIIDHPLEFIFTDGHALSRITEQYNSKQIDQIETLLDWEAIGVKHWNSPTDLDLKRRKEAEFLVLGDVPRVAISGFIVSAESVENRLLEMGVVQQEIIVRPQFYFKI